MGLAVMLKLLNLMLIRCHESGLGATLQLDGSFGQSCVSGVGLQTSTFLITLDQVFKTRI